MAFDSIFQQAQQQAQSQIHLQAIFDSMKEGVIVLDPGGNVVLINKAAAIIHGLEVKPHPSSHIVAAFDVFSPGGTPIAVEDWPSARALRGDFVDEFEFTFRRKDDGKLILTEVDTSPIRDSAGIVTHVIISYHIVQSRNTARARGRLAGIVESSDDAIIGKDLNGIVTSWNRGAQKIFGYSTTEMIGRSVRILLPPGLEEQEDEILGRIRRGETVDHFETSRKRKDGVIINVSLTISPIRDEEGSIVGASKIARDTTEKRQLERQLRQSQKMEAIGQLTGGIAHDFNNLLGVIFGNLDLLERLIADNPTALQRLNTARKAADRGAELTRRMLTFSSKEELRPRTALVDESIMNMVELASRALGPEIRLITRLDPTIPPIFVDGPGLESALLNLVVNSRDAMPGGGSVTIATQLSHLEKTYPPVQTGELGAGDYACISISDTGLGMSPEVLERAFEPFFTTKPRHKGTGLGLAMVYGFVKQSGGTVRIYSEAGLGTTVSLYLPLAQTSPQAPLAAAEKHVARKQTGTVLVVDDEDGLLDIAVAYLEEMGLKTLTAVDGASALTVLHDHKIDLMITDIIMPGGINGIELARQAKLINPELRVISCSGFPAESLAERSMPVTEGSWLHKPYRRQEFETIVRRFLNDEPAQS
jgi:PAS domain S-box-containing protein